MHSRGNAIQRAKTPVRIASVEVEIINTAPTLTA
jgi:hypothetical protein